MCHETRKIDKLQCRLMRGLQNDIWRCASLEGFLPASRAQAPLVSRFQARKAILGAWGAEVISTAFGKCQKCLADPNTHDMHSMVARAGLATTITMPARERVKRTGL